MGSLPAASFPKSFPSSRRQPLRNSRPRRRLGEAAGDLELVFLPSPSLHDGRFANDGWLQELPDPLTKLTWDNPALVSPKTAETLGLANEDVVRIEHAGRSLELPVWILPGMADGVVAVTLGYGRSHAGRVGSGVGFDTFTVRSSKAPGFDSGVRLTKPARTYPLSATQDHGSMEGRPLVRESTVTELRSELAARPRQPSARMRRIRTSPKEENAGALGVFEEEPQHFSLWKEHTYDQGHQWGMTIDLNSCIGCNACMVACQSENNMPVVGKVQVAKGREMHWIRVDRYFSGEPSGSPEVVFQPVPCMQCEDAPCEQVCPVAATVHDAQGLNVMVYNRCIGTRYCSNNCPYKVRHFNFFNYTKDTPDDPQARDEPGRHRARARRHGEVHRTARSGSIGRRSMRRSRDASWATATSRRPASRPARLGDRVRRYSRTRASRVVEGEGRPAQLRAPRGAEHQAQDDLSGQGAQSESRSEGVRTDARLARSARRERRLA